MTEQQQQGASGANEDQGSSGADSQQPGSVAYETHKRLLEQRKADQKALKEVQAKLAEYEAAKAKAEEEELTKKGETQKLLELRQKERDEALEKLARNEALIAESLKLNAVSEFLPGKLKKASYADFIDFDEIVRDPATGKIDKASAKAAADKFMQEYPELIDAKNTPNLPANAPNGNAKVLYQDEWATLPPAERKARYSEMYQNEMRRKSK